MATKIYLAQRTNRHVVKRLDASYVFDAIFGTWGTAQTNTTGLNYPWAIAADPSDNIYVCDGNNSRIMKLDSSLSYVAHVDVSSEIGRPHAITYDSGTGDLYVVGIKNYLTISIARITTALSISKYNDNIYAADVNDEPKGISPDFTANFHLISGMTDFLKVEETGGSFNTAVTQAITGESDSKFFGHIMHSNGDLYLNSKRRDGSYIARVNSSYINIGDSNKISRLSTYITEGLSGAMLIYDNQNVKVSKYDANLNFVADIYTNTGATMQLDAEEIYGMLEIDV